MSTRELTPTDRKGIDRIMAALIAALDQVERDTPQWVALMSCHSDACIFMAAGEVSGEQVEVWYQAANTALAGTAKTIVTPVEVLRITDRSEVA